LKLLSGIVNDCESESLIVINVGVKTFSHSDILVVMFINRKS